MPDCGALCLDRVFRFSAFTLAGVATGRAEGIGEANPMMAVDSGPCLVCAF